jgi:predicted Zn finger-like uncharacterized protein
MRLICPNCDAQYEVDDAAIPAAGRDVQCSSCGHAWFQTHPEVDRERAAEAALHDAPSGDGLASDSVVTEPAPAASTAAMAPPVVPEPAAAAETAEDPARERALHAASPETVPDATRSDASRSDSTVAAAAITAAEPDSAAETEAAGEVAGEEALHIAPDPAALPADAAAPEPAADHAADHGAEPAAAPAEADAQNRQIDEAVMAVLRDEAQREMIARRLEAEAAIEVQPDLGIDDAAAAAATAQSPAARHLARLKGDDPEPQADPGIEPEPRRETSRREMFPDIEEINSSLRPGDVAVGDDGETFEIVRRPQARSGFRSGFVLMLLIAVGIVALYVMAPRIGEQIPAAKPVLEGYVATVDGVRGWLDDATRAVVTTLQGLAGGDDTP